jgi:hypothetical protein
VEKAGRLDVAVQLLGRSGWDVVEEFLLRDCCWGKFRGPLRDSTGAE